MNRSSRARRAATMAAVLSALVVAGCGAEAAPEVVVAQAVAPPALATATSTPSPAPALPESGDDDVDDPAPTEPASSTKRPAVSAAPSRRGTILSAADRKSFRALAASVSGAEGIAVSGLGRGQRVEHVGSLQRAVAWSTAKVPVAMAVVAGGAVQGQQSNLTQAITVSDNASALRLWASLGGGASSARAADEQLRAGGDDDTQIESRALRGGGYTSFGQTSWGLSDQTRFTAGMPCTPAGQQLLELMGQVSAGQRWGLGSAGVPAALKGGWGPGSEPGVGGGYLDRQMGVITVRGKALAVAIATRPADGTHETGTANLTVIARWLASHVDVSRLPTQPRC